MDGLFLPLPNENLRPLDHAICFEPVSGVLSLGEMDMDDSSDEEIDAPLGTRGSVLSHNVWSKLGAGWLSKPSPFQPKSLLLARLSTLTFVLTYVCQ